jgi:hypothetical protein
MYLPRGTSDQRAAFDLAAVIDRERRVQRAVFQHARPDQIAVALDNGVGLAERRGFFGIQRRVDAAKHDVCAASARLLSDAIAIHRVAGMNADADDIARRDGRGIPRLERFVRDDRVAVLLGRRRRKHEQPPGRDDPNAKSQGARVNEVHLHSDSRLKSLRRVCKVLILP